MTRSFSFGQPIAATIKSRNGPAPCEQERKA